MMTKEETEQVRQLGAYHELENVIIRAMNTKHWSRPVFFGNNCIRAMDAYNTKNALLKLALKNKKPFVVKDFIKTHTDSHERNKALKVLDTSDNQARFAMYLHVLAIGIKRQEDALLLLIFMGRLDSVQIHANACTYQATCRYMHYMYLRA